MLKGDGSSQGSAECSAFENGLKSAQENIISNDETDSSSTIKFNLFPHHTEKNIYMIRKGLFEVWIQFVLYSSAKHWQSKHGSFFEFEATQKLPMIRRRLYKCLKVGYFSIKNSNKSFCP